MRLFSIRICWLHRCCESGTGGTDSPTASDKVRQLRTHRVCTVCIVNPKISRNRHNRFKSLIEYWLQSRAEPVILKPTCTMISSSAATYTLTSRFHIHTFSLYVSFHNCNASQVISSTGFSCRKTSLRSRGAQNETQAQDEVPD